MATNDSKLAKRKIPPTRNKVTKRHGNLIVSMTTVEPHEYTLADFRAKGIAPIIVEWEDHASVGTDEWLTPGESERFFSRKQSCFSVGYPAYMDKHVLVLVQSFGDRGEVTGLIRLLRSAITRITFLRECNKK